jgi:glycosyltransferase involved in cell wall biosynthesis
VVFAGRLHPETIREVSKLGLEGLIELPGSVSHAEAVRLMLRSDLLLLHDPQGDGTAYVRGKLYEYIGSGRPILGIVPEGANRELLKRYGRALIVHPEDEEGIKEAVARMVEGRDVPEATPGFDAGSYERRRLTGELAALLDEISGHGAPARPRDARPRAMSRP